MHSSRAVYLDCGLSVLHFENRFKSSTSEAAIRKCRETINRLSSNERFLVAKWANKIIGLCYVEKATRSNILHAIYVLPRFQRRGVGKVLWATVLKFLDPAKDTRLHVLAHNKGAIAFYNKLGFSIQPSDAEKHAKSEVLQSEKRAIMVKPKCESAPHS